MYIKYFNTFIIKYPSCMFSPQQLYQNLNLSLTFSIYVYPHKYVCMYLYGQQSYSSHKI